MKLFSFPHAGGFSSYYEFMRKYGFKNIDEVIVYEYPGRGRKNGITKDSNFRERVERVATAVVEQEAKDGDFILFGHSMGSFVAYETARQLASKYNIQPALVIMSGQNPPCAFGDISEQFDTHRIDVDKFLDKLGGVPEFLKNCPSALNFYKSFILEDMNLLSGYEGCSPEYDDMPPCGAVISGTEDPIVFGELEYRWNENFQNILIRKKYDGGHFYMENSPEKLCSLIDRMAFIMKHERRSLKNDRILGRYT